MEVFENLINLIFSKRKEIKVNLNSKNIDEFIPKIYYIGAGKSGSSSIKVGFPNMNVAHWHNVAYFELIYKTKLLSRNNYDLYDLIIYIGNKYNFKPVIIESVRNPIDYGISCIFQHIKRDRGPNDHIGKQIKECKSNNNIKDAIAIIKKYTSDRINHLPLSCNMFKKHFNIDLLSSFDKDLNYYFNDKNNVYLLFLKFEDIKNWPEIINNNLPYKFTLKHANKTTDKFYEIINSKLKFTKKELQSFLDCPKMTFFYSNDEIDKISKKYIAN